MKTRINVFSVSSINQYASPALRLERDVTAVEHPQKTDCWSVNKTRNHAQNVLTTRLAAKCTIQLLYTIDNAYPLSIYTDTFCTGQIRKERIEKVLSPCMTHPPHGSRAHLELHKTISQHTAAYGHFGRLPDTDGAFRCARIVSSDAPREAICTILR